MVSTIKIMKSGVFPSFSQIMMIFLRIALVYALSFILFNSVFNQFINLFPLVCCFELLLLQTNVNSVAGISPSPIQYFMDRDQPSGSQTQGKGTSASIPLTEEEDSSLNNQTSKLKSDIARFFRSKSDRDRYRLQDMEPLADLMQTFMDSNKAKIKAGLGKILDFELRLTDKYNRSDKVVDYMEKKSGSTESLALKIDLDELD